MTISQQNRLIVALCIIGWSVLSHGTVTILALLIAIPLLPFQKKYRIWMLLLIGILAILFVGTSMYKMSYDSRSRPLKNIAEKLDYSFEEYPSVFDLVYFYFKGPQSTFMREGEYFKCASQNNILSGSYLSTPTLVYDCKEFMERNNPNGGKQRLSRIPDHFSAITFTIPQDNIIPDFAIVWKGMEDLTHLIPYKDQLDSVSKYEKPIKESLYKKWLIKDNFYYIRDNSNFIEYGDSDKKALIFTDDLLNSVITPSIWWYVESNGVQIHFHRRTKNGGVLVDAKDIPMFIDDAYAIYQMILKNPPIAVQ